MYEILRIACSPWKHRYLEANETADIESFWQNMPSPWGESPPYRRAVIKGEAQDVKHEWVQKRRQDWTH